MSVFIQACISTLIVGSLYALVSLGYVVIYRACRIFNFALAETMLIAALLFSTFQPSHGPLVAVLLTLLVSFAVGVAFYWLVFRRLAGRDFWSQVMVSFAIGIVLLALANLLWGTSPRQVMLEGQHTTAISFGQYGGLSYGNLILICTSMVCWTGLAWLCTASRYGMYMRATAENPLLAAQRGIPIYVVIAAAWGIGAAVASIAGIEYGVWSGIDASMVAIGLSAIPAAILGGLNSVVGTLPGSFLLAAAQTIAVLSVGPRVSYAAAFVVLVAVLMFRPAGIFGHARVARL